MIVLAWSAFSLVDSLISHWGSDSVKAGWKAATLHFPFGWQTWAIGLLLIGLVFVYDGSYRHTRGLNSRIKELSWPENRPQLLFDSWGEIPHDHPEVRSFTRTGSSGAYLEYFQRGFYLSNHGGTAHEITCFPIKLADSVYAVGNVVPRIDKDGQGFMIVYMDIEHNAKFMEETERWDLLTVMAALEKKINAARVGETSIRAEIGVCYRDGRGVWYASFCWLTYRKDLNRLIFGPTDQSKTGFLDRAVFNGCLTRD